MKLIQQVKMFKGKSPEDLETQFNKWIRELTEQHRIVPALSATPVKVYEKVLTVYSSTKTTTYVLGVFYDHYDLEATEQGKDRGKHIEGASMFRPKKRR